MKKVSFLLVIALIALASFGAVNAQDGDAPEAIEIGAVVPLTGPFAGGGAQVERGYQMAVEAINAAGGVYVEEYGANLPLNLTLLDDESNPSNTVARLEELNEEGVVAYLGGFGSGLHAAAAAIAEKNGVPYLGVAFALYNVHQQGYEYLFSPFPKSPDLTSTTFDLLDTIPEDTRPNRVAIVHETGDWGDEMADGWREAAADAGYEVVVDEQYPGGEPAPDFTDIILKMQEEDAEVLLALPIPPAGVALFKQMGELGFTPTISMVIRAPDPPTWTTDLGTVGDYVLLSPGWHNAVDYPGVDELNAAHMEMMDRPADPMVGPSYAEVQILAQAIEDAGTLDRAAIRDAIAASDTETVNGEITFNEDGTGNVDTIWLQYQNGRPELVYPLEFATADLVYPAPPFEDR